MGGSKQCDASFQKLRSISKKYKKQKMANEDKNKVPCRQTPQKCNCKATRPFIAEKQAQPKLILSGKNCV